MAANKGILDNDELIDAVTDMLARCWRKSKIKKAVRLWAYERELIEDPEADGDAGGLGAHTIDALVARARKVMLNNVKQSKEEMRALSLSVYQGIVGRQAGKNDRVANLAQKNVDRLMGLSMQAGDEDAGDDLDSLRKSMSIEPQGATKPPDEDEREDEG